MRWMVALIWRVPPRAGRGGGGFAARAGGGGGPRAPARVAVGLARADGDRSDAGRARELGVAGEAAGAGDLADELGGGQRSQAGLAKQLRRDAGDQLGDLGLERLDRLAQLADAAKFVAGDANAHRLLGAGRAPRDARAPVAVEERAAGQLQFGPEVVQMPLQR